MFTGELIVFQLVKELISVDRIQGLIPWLQEHITALYSEKNKLYFFEHPL
jgi:hypothetical protein